MARARHYMWHVENVWAAPGGIRRPRDATRLVMLKPLPPSLAFRHLEEASRARAHGWMDGEWMDGCGATRALVQVQVMLALSQRCAPQYSTSGSKPRGYFSGREQVPYAGADSVLTGSVS